MKRLLLLGVLCLPILAEAIHCDNEIRKIVGSICDAAEVGHDGSQFILSHMYYEGREVKKDYHKSFLWAEMSAKQGNVLSQAVVGMMYENGEGVKKNRSLAKEWYERSCNNGNQGGCALAKGIK